MKIYTDGSTLQNGQTDATGGYAVIAIDKDEKICYNYFKKEEKAEKQVVTNNRCEMKAIIHAFHKFGIKENNSFNSETPVIYSDSSYCINLFTKWMFSWAENDWKRPNGATPENFDLIQDFYNYWQQGYRIEFHWVKGHNKDFWNELVDKLATGKITSEELMEKYGK